MQINLNFNLKLENLGKLRYLYAFQTFFIKLQCNREYPQAINYFKLKSTKRGFMQKYYHIEVVYLIERRLKGTRSVEFKLFYLLRKSVKSDT